MDQKQFRKQLLEALDDPSVIQCFRQVLNSQGDSPAIQDKIQELKEQIVQLQREKEGLEQKNTLLRQENMVLQEKNEELVDNLKQAALNHQTLHNAHSAMALTLENAQKTVIEHQEKLELIAKEQHIFHIYQQLPEEPKTSLHQIFHTDTYEGFVACCAQRDTIDALWLLLKTRLFDGNQTYFEELSALWQYAIQRFNDGYQSPVMVLQSVAPGLRFDSALHLRTPKSQSAGTITACLLPGCTMTNTDKIIQKAIVEVCI